jgi:eukaryotic-like serine/threonine-protein kinase
MLSPVATEDTLDLIGKTVADKYAVESIVGEGGFATVYRATHLTWKRPVALKVFKALSDFTAADREKLMQEFIQEGSILADLSERSAAIVQARDVGLLKTPKGDEIPYMVLEWLEGKTLEEIVHAEKAQGLPVRSIDDAVRLLDPAAEALALAHRKGIAHRDVKPANIFIIGDARTDGCTVKLLDFGIAKVVSDAQKMAGSFTKTGGKVTSFTPAYGAPEQFSRTHGATGPWTDVFALALIVSEVVSGKEALEGDDFLQLAVASSTADRRPTPRTLGAQVSDGVEAVMARALAVKPTDRFASAGEFWNALRQALAMAPMRSITAPDPSMARLTEPGPAAKGGTLALARTDVMAPARAVTESSVTATNPKPPGSSKGKLALGLGALVVALGGGAVVLVMNRGANQDPSASASASASMAASHLSASASGPPGPRCPPGMVFIPGGKFFMGVDEGGLPNERPSHQVILHPFCMDKFEATVGEYKHCSDTGGCKRAGTVNEWEGIAAHDHKVYDPLCNIRDDKEKARHPINCVDWEMADQFCKDHGKRLPTEAEWEFAARGPDGRAYPWGDEKPSEGHLNACGTECVAWAKANGVLDLATPMYDADDHFPNTAPVGSFPQGASRYGVEDVVGNVWEWVADYYGPYEKSEQRDPKGPETGTERVIRGGAWNGINPLWVRPTFRYKDAPTKRSYGIGFRCAR